MPFPRSQLDIICCRLEPDHPFTQSDFDRLHHEWQQVDPTELVTGGFRRFYFDRQSQAVLYANHQGGYRAFCPQCKRNVAASFSHSVSQWRLGNARIFACPHCARSYPLEDVKLRPHGAFATGAVVFSAVGSADLTEYAESSLKNVLGAYQLVYKRVG